MIDPYSDRLRVAVPSETPGGSRRRTLRALRTQPVVHPCRLHRRRDHRRRRRRQQPHSHGGCMSPVLTLGKNMVDAVIVAGIGHRPCWAVCRRASACSPARTAPTCAASSTRSSRWSSRPSARTPPAGTSAVSATPLSVPRTRVSVPAAACGNSPPDRHPPVETSMQAPVQIKPTKLADYLEVLTKAVFQSGMSWQVVEAKWDGFREAFAGFDPEVVAAMTATTSTGSPRTRASSATGARSRRRCTTLRSCCPGRRGRRLRRLAARGRLLRGHRRRPARRVPLPRRHGRVLFLYVVGEQVPPHEEWMAAHPSVARPRRTAETVLRGTR